MQTNDAGMSGTSINPRPIISTSGAPDVSGITRGRIQPQPSDIQASASSPAPLPQNMQAPAGATRQRLADGRSIGQAVQEAHANDVQADSVDNVARLINDNPQHADAITEAYVNHAWKQAIAADVVVGTDGRPAPLPSGMVAPSGGRARVTDEYAYERGRNQSLRNDPLNVPHGFKAHIISAIQMALRGFAAGAANGGGLGGGLGGAAAGAVIGGASPRINARAQRNDEITQSDQNLQRMGAQRVQDAQIKRYETETAAIPERVAVQRERINEQTTRAQQASDDRERARLVSTWKRLGSYKRGQNTQFDADADRLGVTLPDYDARTGRQPRIVQVHGEPFGVVEDAQGNVSLRPVTRTDNQPLPTMSESERQHIAMSRERMRVSSQRQGTRDTTQHRQKAQVAINGLMAVLRQESRARENFHDDEADDLHAQALQMGQNINSEYGDVVEDDPQTFWPVRMKASQPAPSSSPRPAATRSPAPSRSGGRGTAQSNLAGGTISRAKLRAYATAKHITEQEAENEVRNNHIRIVEQ